jgi:hypothetical protein
MQKQYVEKPGKVIAEQFFDAADPPAVGVHRCGLSPDVETGPPHLHGAGQLYMLHDTDWIIAERFTGTPTHVITHAQFEELYGNQPGEDVGVTT